MREQVWENCGNKQIHANFEREKGRTTRELPIPSPLEVPC